ncbi:MAG TPA: ABC transporter permease [Alphaproteobacteria bacterium]|nr:ABC transporter permease [Alphaproteobacteria bacterium]
MEQVTGQGQASFARAPGLLLLGGAIVLAYILLAILAGSVSGYDPDIIDLNQLLQPPSALHWFGTDHLGRDVFSRVIHGARIDLYIGFAGVIAPLLIGTLVGLVSGFFGGPLDALMMRLVDLTVAFPFFVLVLAIVAALGPGVESYFIALACVGWVTYARIIRAEVLVIRSRDYIAAARTLGLHPLYILIRHVLPNAISPVAVYVMTDIALIIVFGASLGFLGMGSQPPTAEWGVMIADGQTYISSAWWICFFPGVAIVLLGLGFSFLGDGLASLLRAGR